MNPFIHEGIILHCVVARTGFVGRTASVKKFREALQFGLIFSVIAVLGAWVTLSLSLYC